MGYSREREVVVCRADSAPEIEAGLRHFQWLTDRWTAWASDVIGVPVARLEVNCGITAVNLCHRLKRYENDPDEYLLARPGMAVRRPLLLLDF